MVELLYDESMWLWWSQYVFIEPELSKTYLHEVVD
jgi:hypothetical protein